MSMKHRYSIDLARAERRAAKSHEGATRGPWPARASRETRPALMPSKPTQVGSEPRHSLPSGDRPMYSSDEGSS